MAERPLYTLYKNLKAQNYDVPDDYNKFESALTRDGKGGADNRHAIYENLKAQNFDVPDTYERFYSALFEPRSKTSSRAKGGSVPMSAADRARFSARTAEILSSANNAVRQAKRNIQTKLGQAKKFDGGRVTPRLKNPLQNQNVQKNEFNYNSTTGKTGTYTTTDGVEFDNEYDAAQYQNKLDKQGEQYINAVNAGDIPSVFDVRNKKGNYDLQENIGKNGTYLTEEGAQKQFDKKLADAYARKKEIEAAIAEDHRLHGNPLLSYGASVGASNGRTAEQSDYSNKLATSLALVKQQIGALEAVKQYPTSSWGEDALKALDNTVFTAKTWDFGLTDFATMGQMERIKTKMDNNIPLSGSDKMLLKSKLGSDAAAALEDEKMGNIYRWTKIAGQSLPFMADFFLTGGYGGITKGISRVALKFAAKRGMGKVSAAILKNTGIVAGDVIGSYAMAGTEQALKTGADIMQRHLGNLYQDEKGDYKFGTFDENGNLLHEGGESIGTALYKGMTSAMVENYTEKLFGHNYGIKKGAVNFMEKHGMNASAEFFKNIGKSGWYTNSKKWMEKFGINGFAEEVMEEEIGIPLHALLDGEGKVSDLLDARQQLDIIGGMAISVGSMYAMGAGSRPVKGIYNRAQYYRFRNKVNVADSDAQNLMGDNWADIKDKIDNATNEQMGGVLADILRQRDTMTKEQINAAVNYGVNLMKMRGYNIAKTAEMNAREITNEPTTPEEQHQADIDNAYSEGHDADDADKHDIQIQQEDQMKILAAALGISEQQLSAMSDEELESLTGQDDKLDQAIYDYQLSSARYQGVVDDAQDKVDLAAHQAEQRVDMYTDQNRGSVRNATIKASGGLEDYGVYIISGNIATHDDGSIDVSNSDDMILYYDPTTNSVEHADALMFAELGEELPADEVKAQAVADAKENAIKEVAGIIDGTVEVGSQFNVTDTDGTEHTYEVLADYGDGTAAISIDGNVVENPYSLADLQQMKDLEDQKRLEAAKAEREQMEKERIAQQNQETEQAQPSFDFNQILNDNGNVVLVDVLDKDGNTKYPDSRLFLIRDAGAKAKVVELKSDGTLVPHAVNKEDVATISSMSLDEYKQAMPESSMIEDNSGEESDEDSQLANLGLPKGSEIWMSGDGLGRPKESTLSRVVGIDEQGSIILEDKDGKKWSASFDYINNHRELPPLDENTNIVNEENNQPESNAEEKDPAPEQTPAITLEDGTEVPMLDDGNPDFSKLTAAQTAELYDTQFGDDAESVISSWVSDAKKALDKASNMTVKGKTFVEQKAAKDAKEKAIADAQAAYDSAIAIRDAYNERQLAKVEDTAEGRRKLIEKARRKFARLKSAVKDDAEAVSQLYRETVGSLLHRLYDSTGIDVTDTTPLTAEEYVASNIGAHSLNYEGTETSKGVKQETGLSREDFAKTQLLAADGKGTTIDALIHSLWENRPSNLESLDTQDIRNALIGVLNSGFKASEARNFVENIRIAQAENILEEQKRAQENAAYAEQQKAELEAEQKAKSDEKAELQAKSEEKTHSEAFNKIVDLAKNLEEILDNPDNVKEIDKITHEIDELLETLSDEEFKEVSDVLLNIDEDLEYLTADEYERREGVEESKKAKAYNESLQQAIKRIAPYVDALKTAVKSGDKKAIAKAQKELADALLASNLGHGYLSGQLEYAKSAKKKDESYSERRALVKPLTDAINAIESALDSALTEAGLEGVHVDFTEGGNGWIYADNGSAWSSRLKALDNDYRNVSQYETQNPISELPQVNMDNVAKVAGIIKSRIEEGERYNSDEYNDEDEQTKFPDKLKDGSETIEVPDDATDENPLGAQRDESDLPFSAKENGKQQTTAERAADVEKNKVDDMKVVDNIVGEKTRKAFERLAKMMGAEIQWQYSDKLGNGWIQETKDADGNVHRTIFITLDSSITEGAQFIFGHEMTHQIKNLNPAAYNELTQLVLDTYGSDAFDKAVDETMKRYSDAGFSGRSRDYYAEEVVADAVGEMIRDLNLAHTLAMKMSHPLLAAIHEILHKIKLAFFGTEYSDVTKNIIRSIEQAYVKTANGQVTNSETGEDVSFSLRQKPEPKKKGIGYKVFVLKDGKLYPPMVANPNGAATPVGVWLDADAAPIAGESKTGRPQVKQGGKGTQGGSGKLAYRPGWHLGVVPYAIQFNRKDADGNKTLFPKNFVFAEVEYAADVDYQEEARQEGINPSGKYQHSLAGLKHLPTDGFYMYRTNPNPETDPWVITGAMKVNRILTRAEQAELVKKAGREPQQIQDGDIVTDDVVNSINQEIADAPKFSLKVYHGSGADFTEFDFDHMGEGAGSQVFGWGGYVTSSEEIGKSYARLGKETGGDYQYMGDTKLTSEQARVLAVFVGLPAYKEYSSMKEGVGAYIKSLRTLEQKGGFMAKHAGERINVLESVLPKLDKVSRYDFAHKSRNLYEVDIPDDNGSNYLEWYGDVPSNLDKEKLAELILDKTGAKEKVARFKATPAYLKGLEFDIKKLINEAKTCQRLYVNISSFVSEKDASEILSSLGYTGIKYPAGTIMGGAEENDTNYVIFKPEDMKITEHTKFSIKTYHGSQASFDHFDHSFMGSGEGAQAYGWGTYVSEVEGIAKAYAKQNASFGRISKISKYLGTGKSVVNAMLNPSTHKKTLLRLIDNAIRTNEAIQNSTTFEPMLEEAKKALSELKTAKEMLEGKTARNLYSVDIPDDTGENYIGWDEPLTDNQVEMWKNAANSLAPKDDDGSWKERVDYYARRYGYNFRGEKAYKLLTSERTPKEVSLALKDAGFVGVKVIAQRNTGGNKEGKMNYVIFDENNAQITSHTKFSLRLKSAIEETETNPSDAQKESGNYKKGHIKFGGYDYTIENPKGSTRSGKDVDGKEWKVTMHDTYGYIRGKFGKDGDHLDMFINDKADLDNWNGDVFVVDQVNPDGSFDEHKVMYGYDSMDDAKKAYLANYSKGWQGLGNITGASKDEFDKWLDTSNRKLKPFADYAKVKFTQAQSVNNEAPKTFDEFLNHPSLKFSIKNEQQRKAAEDAYEYASKLRPNKYAQYALVDMSNPSNSPEYFEKKVLADRWRRFYNKAVHNELDDVYKDAWGNYKLFDLDRPFADQVNEVKGDVPNEFNAPDVVANKNADNESGAEYHEYKQDEPSSITYKDRYKAFKQREANREKTAGLRKERKEVEDVYKSKSEERIEYNKQLMKEYMDEHGLSSENDIPYDVWDNLRNKSFEKYQDELDSLFNKYKDLDKQIKALAEPRFSLKDEKTLAGVHNITEEKLRKALKLGGLANPSLAVIDTSKSAHDNFGEISFIAPSALVDKRTGKTGGTWITDAYTQRYPSVERQMSEKGSQKFEDWVDSLEYPSAAKAEIKRQTKDVLEDNGVPAWELMYLKEKGIDIKAYDSNVDYRWKEIINKYPTVDDILNSMQNDSELNEDVTSLAKYQIVKPTRDKISLEVRRQIYKETGVKTAPISPKVRKKVNEIFDRDYKSTLLDKDGKPKAEDVKKVVEQMVKEHNDTKKYDFYLSKVKASNYVNKNGLYADYIRWQENKLDEFGTKNRIFRGYKKDGSRKYVPETLENVSKAMREEADGQTNGGEYTSFGSFIAKLASRVDSTGEMRANKDKLSSNEDKEAFYEKWQDVYYDLAKFLYNDVFYGEQRLHDIVLQPDPKKYAKKEYGITLTPTFMKKLDALKNAVQTELKSAYFETKYNRPIRLNEFAAAVVPDNLGEDVRKGIENAGLPMYNYDPNKEGDRKRAFNEAINSSDNIRFSLAGERGAAAADKVEERTTRMDFLSVARKMEEEKKDAKAIKMATGWERGADGKWRYEMPDVVLRDPKEWVNKKNLTLSDIVEKPNDLFKEYPELFDAYPELKDMKIIKGRAKSGGVFYNNAITLNLGDIREAIKYDLDTHYKLANNSLKKTLVHEIQHYIQEQEGFAQGGNSEMIVDKNALDAIAKLRAEKDAVAKEFYAMSPDEQQKRKYEINNRYNDLTKQIERLEKSSRIGYDGYKRLAGEVEARNVSARLNMTPEERRKTLAESTEDVARKDQIFLGVGDVSFSLRDMADGKESGVADMAEDLKSLNTPDEVDDAIKTAIDDMPSGWKIANRKIIHIAEALGENRKAEIAGEEPKFSIRTYHGTGASFDKFDLSHALEGEGSETFGHGVYVTNSSKIGREYAQRAKQRKMEELYKNMRYPDGVKGDIFKRRVFGEMVNDVATGGSVESAKEFAKKRVGADANDIQRTLENLKDREKGTEYEQNLKDRLAEYKEGLKWIDSLDEDYLTQGNANRYDVDIPDDNGSNYLDWENPMSDEQINAIRDALAKKGVDVPSWEKRGFNLDLPFKKVYYMVLPMMMRSKPEDVSKFLSSLGFTGIKYPAGMVYGGAKKGDTNYVIFDENNANIVGNTRFSLRYDQFEHDLNQWKKDNNLPKDAQRPTIPQRNAGESAVDFLRRVDEYRKQMALWKTAPTYEQHLLSDDTALGEFNRELQRGSVLKRIAFQDSMLAIRKAQEAIMKEVGVDRLNMAEDAYTAENRSHGKGKNEFEEYNNEFLQPLRKAYHQMKKVLGDSYDNVRIYMMAKHGLERDAQMAFKMSLDADFEDVAQRSAAYRAYKGDMNRIINDSDLEFGRVDFTTWRQRDNALRAKYSPSYMNYRYDKNGIVYDYSGLSALFEGSDFEEAAYKLVKDIEDKYVTETHNLWDATNAATKKILRDGYKAGMMSKDTYQYVRDMYSHYIPLRGWDGTTADQVWDYVGGGKGAFNQTLKTAHGRTSIADDPIAYIENMAESGILLNNKNWVKQHLMLLAQNHPTSLLTLSKAWYVKSVDANGNEEWIPATPQITSKMNSNQVKAAIDAFEKKMEQMAQAGDATQKRDGLNIAYPQTHSEEREHEVRVMKDGEEYVIYVNGDPQLAQAMNNTRAHRVREIQSGKLDRAAAWLGRKMAAAYTSLSPLFIPSNYFRDLTMTLASTAIREDAKYNYLLRKNLATSWNLGFMLRDYQNGKLRDKVSNGNATPKEQMFYDFMMNGGETGFVSSLDVEDLKKKFKNDLKDLDRWKANPVKVGHTIMDSIEFLNRAIEDSNRFAVYMTSIQYGRSIDEAVNDAKDVTLNFNRKGTGEYGWQTIRNLYLFINPAVQSLQILGALAKHHPFKFTAVTASWLASGVLVPIVNAALMSLFGGDDDKDKYWQFSKWDRRNNFIMWVPTTNEFVKIPLAQEFRAFYGVGDMIASKMMGGELAEESWSQYAEDLLGQVVDMLPLDPTGYDGNIAVSLMPNAIRPVFELAFNVDFTGKPLFKDTEYNKYDPNFTKAYVGTPDWMVRASRMVNSIGNDYPDVQQNKWDALGNPRYNMNNPAVVDHVLSSYLGGAYTMGSQVLGLLTKSLNDPKEIKVADIPLFSKFVSNPDDRPVSKKQGDEFWDKKEYYDRASNTISKLKKQAKIDGDYSLLKRFYGSDEYKTYKLYEKDVKDYKEARKKERAEESGDEYRPHQLNAEDIYNNHATPMDEFEDMKLKQLFEKLNSFKTRYDAIVDNAPNESDAYYNTNKAAIDAIDEISLDKKEISELKKGFLDDGKDAYNAEDMKRIRDLRKKILSVLEKANKVVVANQKAKAEK